MNIEKLISIYDKFVKSKGFDQEKINRNLLIQALKKENEKKLEESLNLYDLCKKEIPNNALINLKIGSNLEKLKKNQDANLIIKNTINNNLSFNYKAIDAFNTHQSAFLERHIMAEFINSNKDIIKEKINIRLKDKIENKYKVFVFWDHPDQAPAIVKSAIESIKTYVDGKFDLIILHKENLGKYIDIPHHIQQLMINNPTHFSDWLRTKLLRKYGGIWLDATCYMTQSLSESLLDIEKQETFFFTYKGSRVGSWFIYSDPNSYILNAIDVVMDLWWEKEAYLTNYFMYHDIIEMLYWVDTDYKKNWDVMLKIHPSKALEMNKNLQNNFDLNLYNQISTNFFLHKLTYKVNPASYTKNTFIKKISEDSKQILIGINEIKKYLKNFVKFWIYKNEIYVFELLIDDINYAYDIYIKEDEICLDIVHRNNKSLEKISLLNKKEKVNIYNSKNILDITNKVLEINDKILKEQDVKYDYDITYILTSYNREKIIIKSLESLRKQKNENIKYEVLVIDDFSNDNTINIIEDYILKHNLKNFKLIKKSYNSGNPSIPRNDGIFLAKGKYLSFLDSDDYLDPDTINNAVSMAENNISDIVFIKIGSTTGGRQGFGENIFKSGNVNHADFITHHLWSTPQIFHVFRTKFLIDNRVLFNPTYRKWEDLVFISKAMSNTNKYSILADKIYYYLEDFQGDNLTFKDLNINEQCEIIIDALNNYVLRKDKVKFTAYMNRISSFVVQKLKSKSLTYEDKIFVLNLFKRNIDLKLIDFSAIDHLTVIKLIISNDFDTAIKLYN